LIVTSGVDTALRLSEWTRRDGNHRASFHCSGFNPPVASGRRAVLSAMRQAPCG
jgi:hypothetical protein